MDFRCFYFPLFCIHWLMGKKIVAGSHEAQNGDSGYIFEYITMFHNYCFF